jgi:TPR repeat protein
MHGRTKDGLHWLRRSARLGNALSMGGIAQVHVDKGRIGRAKWWLRAAARLGNPQALPMP